MSKTARILALTALLVLGGGATAQAATGTAATTATAATAAGHPAVTVQGVPCMAC